MPAASQRPFGSARARVAIVSPDAMPGSNVFFWSSVPPLRIALAASATVAKNGAHSSARPISSNTMPSSTKVKPWPPYSSGMCSACRPSSCAICFHTASS